MRFRTLALAAGAAGAIGLAAPALAQEVPSIRADLGAANAGAAQFDEWMAQVAAPRTDKGGEVNDGRLWQVQKVEERNGVTVRTTIVANTPIPDNATTEQLWPGQADLWARDASAVERR